MKVAFCFCGQPRNVAKTLENIKESWGTHQKLDFFFHTWKPDGTTPYRIDTPSDFYFKGIENYLIKKLNPIKYEFEEQIIFEKQYEDSPHWPTRSVFIPNPSQNIQSFFYSLKKSNDLKREYEIENNFRYDCVIRCRFDYIFTKQYNVRDFDLDYLNVKNDCKHTEYAINDHVAVSSSENIDVYCSVIDNLENYYNQGIEFNTEVMLGYNAMMHGLKYHKTLGDGQESYVSTQFERAKVFS